MIKSEKAALAGAHYPKTWLPRSKKWFCLPGEAVGFFLQAMPARSICL